jgi:integrase
MMTNLQIRSVNTHISTIVQFYKWAQDEGFVSNIIGPVEAGKPPRPIRLVPKGRYKRLVSDLLLRNLSQPIAPTPTQKEVDAMYKKLANLDDQTCAERNCLLADWAVQTGLRRFEILGLSVNDIPDRSLCAQLEDADQLHYLYVIGKGGKRRAVPVLPSLLLQTHAYIRRARRDLVSNLPAARDSGSLFVSPRTGLALNRTYVSRLFSQAFKNDKERKLTLHRLRARFASKLVQNLLFAELKRSPISDLFESTILFKAAAILGHKDIETLRPYLHLALDLLDADVAAAIRAARPEH